MKRYFIIITFILFPLLSIYAQGTTEPQLPPRPETDTLDYSTIRCLYRQRVMKDSLKPEKLTEDIMMLQIGKNITKYADFLAFQRDSLILADYNKDPNIDSFLEKFESNRYKRGNDVLNLFRNYPSNKNTSINGIYIDRYIFEEDILLPQWQIGKETKNILGYHCMNATCRYYGRNYTAWFTLDLPILNGPWKLTGLPGLILEAYDEKKQYSFECIQIQTITWNDPITIYRRKNIMKTSKTMYYKMLKQFCDNPQSVIGTQNKIQSSSTNVSKKLPYNPLELTENPH